jgi:hypothetical protein
MSILKKILFVLFNIVLGAVFTAFIASFFVTYNSGWDAIGGTLGWLFFGGAVSLLLSIFSLQKLPLELFNKAFLLSLTGIAILTACILWRVYVTE